MQVGEHLAHAVVKRRLALALQEMEAVAIGELAAEETGDDGRDQAAVDFGVAQAEVVGGDGEVAGGDEARATAQCCAVGGVIPRTSRSSG